MKLPFNNSNKHQTRKKRQSSAVVCATCIPLVCYFISFLTDRKLCFIIIGSLPTKVKECIAKNQNYLHKTQQLNEFGQNRLQLALVNGGQTETAEEVTKYTFQK